MTVALRHVSSQPRPVQVAVSGLDILAPQRRRSAAGSISLKASALRTLRRRTAPDRDHRWQWPSPRQPRSATTGVGESQHELSGQRMMRMKTRKASGRASALRVGHTIAPTANFKTRFDPCRIAVRADLEKCEQFASNRPRGSEICTSSGDQQSRIPSRGRLPLRLTEHRKLVTAAMRHHCVSHTPRAAATPPGFLNKCLELRLEWLLPPQAHSARPRT